MPPAPPGQRRSSTGQATAETEACWVPASGPLGGETQQRQAGDLIKPELHSSDMITSWPGKQSVTAHCQGLSTGPLCFKTHLLHLHGHCPNHPPCLHCLSSSHLGGPRPQVRAAFPHCHGKDLPRSHHIPSLGKREIRKNKSKL